MILYKCKKKKIQKRELVGQIFTFLRMYKQHDLKGLLLMKRKLFIKRQDEDTADFGAVSNSTTDSSDDVDTNAADYEVTINETTKARTGSLIKICLI